MDGSSTDESRVTEYYTAYISASGNMEDEVETLTLTSTTVSVVTVTVEVTTLLCDGPTKSSTPNTTSMPPAASPGSSKKAKTPKPSKAASSKGAVATAPPGNADPVATEALNKHNSLRALHGSPPLVWNETLAAHALTLSSACQLKHSGPYGQNLAMYISNEPVTHGIMLWYNESLSYDYAEPSYVSLDSSKLTGISV